MSVLVGRFSVELRGLVVSCDAGLDLDLSFHAVWVSERRPLTPLYGWYHVLTAVDTWLRHPAPQ